MSPLESIAIVSGPWQNAIDNGQSTIDLQVVTQKVTDTT